MRAVWVSRHKAEGWTKDRLRLATDPTLAAEEVITGYSLRWSTEPMFNSLKNAPGAVDAPPSGPAALAAPGPAR